MSRFKSVAVCGSAKRAKTEIIEFIRQLEERGVTVFAPILLLDEEGEFEKLSSDFAKAINAGLTLHHFSQIDKAEVVYIYNKDSYIGISVTMEIVHAHDKNKIIYLKEPDQTEPCRAILTDGIIPDVDSLILKLL